mgnify:FL=1
MLAAAATGIVGSVAGCADQSNPGTETDDRPSPATGTGTPTSSPVGSPTDTETSGPTTAPTPDRTAPLNGPWPTVHADAANTGAVDTPGPQGTPSVRWREHVSLDTAMGATAGPDGPVATQSDGTVVAYDNSGELRWRYQHTDEFVATPVVADDGAVVVGGRDGTVLAFDSDGTRRWKLDTPDGLFPPHANDATVFEISDDTVVLAHPRGELYRLALSDGTVRWRSSIPSRTHRPAVADGRVYLTAEVRSSDGSVVVARSLADGAEEWRRTVDGSIHIGPGIDEAVVYAADIDGLVTAHDADDGTEQWRVRIESEPWISTIPVVFGGRVWVGTLSEGLYVLTENGVETHVEIGSATTPAVGDGLLYLGSTAFGESWPGSPVVTAVDADGTEKWRTPTRGHPESQVTYRDGRLVVGTGSGVVERFTASGDRDWQAFERPARLPAPVVGPATVYYGGQDEYVDGARVSDGTSHLWSTGFEGPTPGTPAVAGETVLAGSTTGEVSGTPLLEYAETPTGRLTRTATPDPGATPTPHFDAPSPETRWRSTLDGPVGDIGYGTDLAYLGAGTDVVSLTVGGAVGWQTDVGSRVRTAPAVVGGTVYAATVDGTVVALAAEDGTVQWRQSVGAAATAPAVAREGPNAVDTLALGTDAGVVALAANDGSERWRTGSARVRGAPAVTDSAIVAGDDAGLVRGLDRASGDEHWRVETGGAINGSPAVADGTAYVGSRDSRLYAVSVADGSVEWRLELPDWVDGSPAVAYGAVFVTDQSGALHAVVGDE